MLFFGAAYLAVRRAMERDQERPPSVHPPVWRLVLEEVALLARRVGRWLVTAVAAATAATVLAVLIALSDRTPGPSVALGWRLLVACAAGCITVALWACGHAVRREASHLPDP